MEMLYCSKDKMTSLIYYIEVRKIRTFLMKLIRRKPVYQRPKSSTNLKLCYEEPHSYNILNSVFKLYKLKYSTKQTQLLLCYTNILPFISLFLLLRVIDFLRFFALLRYKLLIKLSVSVRPKSGFKEFQDFLIFPTFWGNMSFYKLEKTRLSKII